MRVMLAALVLVSLGASVHARPNDGSCVVPTNPRDLCADYALITGPTKRPQKSAPGGAEAAEKARKLAERRLYESLHGGIATELR